MHRLVLPCLLALALAPLASAASTTSPTFGTAGTPVFDLYAAPSSLRSSGGAGEPSIGIPWDSNHAFYQAFSSTYKVVFDDARLTDGRPAAEWTDVSPVFTRTNVDPMLLADHVSNRVWAGGLEGACSLMGMSDDDGATWVPAGNMCNFAQFDHQSIGAGKWSASPLPRATVYSRATYYCSQLQQDVPLAGSSPGTACTTSPDGGLTWLPFAEVLGGCGGLHGHIRVSEVTGTAAVPDASCHTGEGSPVPGGVVTAGPNRIGFGYTTDNGVTWSSRTMPTSVSAPGGFDPSLDFSRQSGWLYLAQADQNGLHVAMSKDEGGAWEQLGGATPGVEPAPWLNLSAAYHDPVSGAPIKFATFADTLTGDDQRAAIAFLGATDPAGRHPFGNPATDVTGQNYLDPCPKDADPNVWHPYLAQTFDAGQGWTVTRLSEDPIQVGSIWDGGGGVDCRNLLDFAGIDMDAHGRIHIALADGCQDRCAQKHADWRAGKGPAPEGKDSRAAHATILRQTTGLGLFAKDDGMGGAGPGGSGATAGTATGKGTPGLGLAPLAVALAAGLALRRRR
jgi:hypothetical protein